MENGIYRAIGVSCSWCKKRNYDLTAQFKIKEEQNHNIMVYTKFSTFHSSRDLKKDYSNALGKSEKQTEKNGAKLNREKYKVMLENLTAQTQEAYG